MDIMKNKLAVKFGSKGGKSKSPRKIKASRLNGKLGGRPKKAPPEITLTSNNINDMKQTNKDKAIEYLLMKEWESEFIVEDKQSQHKDGLSFDEWCEKKGLIGEWIIK